MTKCYLSLVAITLSLGFVATGVAAQDIPAKPPSFYWARFPSSDQFGRFYPAIAQRARQNGEVTLNCAVADTEGRVTCVVLNETPILCTVGVNGRKTQEPCGFGAAGVSVIETFGRVEMSRGAVPIGTEGKITVRWAMG